MSPGIGQLSGHATRAHLAGIGSRLARRRRRRGCRARQAPPPAAPPGRGGALEPPGDGLWAAGDPPPRPGCELEVLVDGARAFPAIAEAMRGARESSTSPAGTSRLHFDLVRGERPGAIGVLLAEPAERIDVRVMVWAGRAGAGVSPHPQGGRATRSTSSTHRPGSAARSIRASTRSTAITRRHVTVDGELAFVGGIDMTDFGGDRFDTSDHPARRRLGWHDVGTRLRGPAVSDVAEHFALRWRELTGEQLPPAHRRPRPPASAPSRSCARSARGCTTRSRTASSGSSRATSARSARRSASSTSRTSSCGRRRSSTLLADKLRYPPSDDFRLVILLPAEGQQRPGRHPRPARGARRRRRRARAASWRRRSARAGRARRPAVRPRQGRGSSTTAG